MKTFKIASTLIIILFTILFFLGPGWVYVSEPSLTAISIDEPANDYIFKKESAFKNIKQNNEAHILWANSEQKKTEYALVYLHGFSAGPKEISPVLETLAEQFKMNVYFSRLSAHGLENGLMLDLTSDQLFQDAEEAYTIAKKIGDNIIIVGTSTGASLAVWLASRHKDIDSLVLISPNFGISDPKGILAAGPLGNWIARLVVGPYYEWKPKYENQDKFWTTRYSVNGVRAMTDVIREVENLDLAKIQTPSLVLWTAQDTVVNIQKALNILKTLGSTQKTFVEFSTPEHVLAGDITSPSTTSKAVEAVSNFLKSKKLSRTHF
jgi:esterase/lipase